MPITTEERTQARDLLTGSLATLRQIVHGSTPVQLAHSDGGWTPLLILEHLYVVEAGVIRRVPQSPPPEILRPDRDAKIIRAVRDRSVKLQAPEAVVPQGRTTDPAVLLAKLDGVRQRSLVWLDDPAVDHRAHAMEHPFLRTLDGYQWMLLVGCHMERHTAQIREILAVP